ncbi:MAG TPA: class I SAM-dependent methyltransferase [Candidatus Polarisedimenticolaceae bacterium]|nr:class I SAM-dependent methyltransferase [Candidatus Polarisedimenticolaceae bacterium]
MRIVRTRRGARIVGGGAVISEMLARPGATHSVFDVLAAAIAALAPGPRVAVLGFAAGGLLGPLRAMGHRGAIDAVDIDPTGERLFRRSCRAWAGVVRFSRSDAVRWLTHRRRRFDFILEDLSIVERGRTTKPVASFETLPRRMHRALSPGGFALFNLLSVDGMSWSALERAVGRPYRSAVSVRFDEFENRLVLARRGSLESTRTTGRALRGQLRSIDSRLAGRIELRTL